MKTQFEIWSRRLASAKTSRDFLSFVFYWTILFRDQLEKFLQNYKQTRQSILNMNWIQLGLEGVKFFAKIQATPNVW